MEPASNDSRLEPMPELVPVISTFDIATSFSAAPQLQHSTRNGSRQSAVFLRAFQSARQLCWRSPTIVHSSTRTLRTVPLTTGRVAQPALTSPRSEAVQSPCDMRSNAVQLLLLVLTSLSSSSTAMLPSFATASASFWASASRRPFSQNLEGLPRTSVTRLTHQRLTESCRSSSDRRSPSNGHR